ncbi:MAG: tRNA (adenosine(37)-N6)-threonylcarbamoyltransferase complex ATPase subunit type 1 TsaE [Planctomycetota bacterium]|nr:MAG: tRNA (adenosine(37)-N6)-threonylcarbamoyltransferase complex ATPase subunit type 1 TsaE [Planctomycetota bacterium]
MDFKIVSNSPDETIELGRKIGAKLKGGEIIAVCGALGSGKTHLIKGIAAGAGAKDSKDVTSPTFVIVNEYAGRLDIYHIDAYRLDSIEEFEMIGFDDYCGSESVVVIEWADKIESALEGADYIRIELFDAGQSKRKIQIQGAAPYLQTGPVSPPRAIKD